MQKAKQFKTLLFIEMKIKLFSNIKIVSEVFFLIREELKAHKNYWKCCNCKMEVTSRIFFLYCNVKIIYKYLNS